MVELLDISKQYGKVRAVCGVSLTLGAGVVTGLLGPNGAGKSTIIRIVAGLLSPSAGSARVCGFDTLTQAALARAQVGYLAEFAPLYAEMTPREYLAYRAGLYGLGGRARRGAIDRAIGECDLGELQHREVSALSKGYRQRVGLAAAILHDPRVLVLDEPTTGLDPTQIRHSRELFRRLALGRVVLLSSHILPEIEATCDRIVILARGRVRADGTPAALLGSSMGLTPCVVEAVLADELERLAAVLCGLGGPGGPGALGVVREVERVSEPDGRRVLRVLVRDGVAGEDPLSAIAGAARAAGIMLRQLYRPSPTLEQVFLRVVAEVPGELDGAEAVRADGADAATDAETRAQAGVLP